MTPLKNIAILVTVFMTTGCASSRNSDIDFPNDFNGLWMVTEFDEIIRPNENDPDYTDWALKRRAFFYDNFDPVNESASVFCNNIGMPLVILARARDYAREIYQTQNRIYMTFEYMDEYRTIHLDKDSAPDGFYGSKMGFSTAHWDGDELVVKTSGFSESTPAGDYQRSEEMSTTERWRLIEHPEYGEAMELEIEVIDPVVYNEPRYGRALWKRAPEGTVINEYNCPGARWEDYVFDKIDAEGIEFD